MITGRCLCGGIAYEIRGEFGGAVNCHCSVCRRHTGSAFLTAAMVPRANFTWTKGQELLRTYQSSAEGVRIFCGNCGSNLASGAADPKSDLFFIHVGTIDGDPGVRIESHMFVGSKAPWFEITDALPQHDTYPPQS